MSQSPEPDAREFLTLEDLFQDVEAGAVELAEHPGPVEAPRDAGPLPEPL